MRLGRDGERHCMRILVFAAALSGIVLLAQDAHAQAGPTIVETPRLPMAPADVPYYCVYESRVYSVGAGLCIGKVGYVCLPSVGPATGNRAYWTSKEDQLFPRPACVQ